MTDVLFEQTYRASDSFSDHAENEVCPEYVQTEKDQQHHIEEVVAKEGRVVMNRVDPGTVDEPETAGEKLKSHVYLYLWSFISTNKCFWTTR